MFGIEILTGVLFVLSYLYLGETLFDKLMYLGMISSLIVIFFADVKYMIIPDSMLITLFLFATGHHMLIPFPLHVFATLLFTGLIIMLPMLFLFLITKGRGMGFGDVKLAFVIGYLFGIRGGVIVLYMAFILGATVGILLILRGRKSMKQTIPFGPFLVIGIAAMLVYLPELIRFSYRFFP
jgi:prepilin signal peptidase PulO-like enzyme (type II secretory pathway)